MSKYIIYRCYPISKHHTDSQLYCYADNEEQADTDVKILYNNVNDLITKLSTKYAMYLRKHPHCKMAKYIHGLWNVDFVATPVYKFSQSLVRTNSWLVTDYPKNYDVALDEVRLNGMKKRAKMLN